MRGGLAGGLACISLKTSDAGTFSCAHWPSVYPPLLIFKPPVQNTMPDMLNKRILTFEWMELPGLELPSGLRQVLTVLWAVMESPPSRFSAHRA